MEKKEYDVCIIGGGPAGFAAAMRSYDFGNRVLIVESDSMGGAGIENGALSSKTMWELSNDYANAVRTDRGFRASSVSVSFDEVKTTVTKATDERKYHLLSQIETCSKEGKDRSVTLLRGFARFKDNKTIIVDRGENEDIEVVANNFVVATGSTPREHPLLKIDGKRIITSDHIFNLDKFPKRILIIGAGIVGCEFATIFANFGQTEVHVLDSRDRVVPFEDEDVSDYVDSKLTDIGVRIHHKVTLREIYDRETHIDVVLDYEDGHTEVIVVDNILISIGRVPNTSNIGLENTDAEITDRGLVKVDDSCKAGEGIYAIGDISGHMALVNVGEMEGRFAAKAIQSEIHHPLRYQNMATIMFFKPEISCIGLTEQECQQKNIAYKVITYSHAIIPRAIAMRATSGFFKIITTNEENPLILGMRAAGPQSNAATIFIAAHIDSGTRLKDMLKTVHPHPSMSEGIQECLRVISHKSILKPKAFPTSIKFREWSPDN